MPICFLQWLLYFTFPQAVHKGSNSYVFDSPCYFSFFRKLFFLKIKSILVGMKKHLTVILISNSLMISYVAYLWGGAVLGFEPTT
jgi:hypothetical protein